MVAMVGNPGSGEQNEMPDGSEHESEVLQTMVRRIMAPKQKQALSLATLRLILTLLQSGNEGLFHEACMRRLFVDARETASVVSTEGVRGDPNVLTIHAAREILGIRPVPFESNPDGPNYYDYVADARAAVEERRSTCVTWKETYVPEQH